MTQTHAKPSHDTQGGPHWDNSSEYVALNSPDFEKDVRELATITDSVNQYHPRLLTLLESAHALTPANTEALDLMSALFALDERFTEVARNLRTFVECELAVDGGNAAARICMSEMDKSIARQHEAIQPLSQLTLLASDDFVDALCSRDSVRSQEFLIRSRRWWKPYLLSLPEETLSTRLELNGPMAFAQMYDGIQSSLECSVHTPEGTKTMGMAMAAGLLQSENESTRKSAYHAINKAWGTQREACAAVLNGLSGWRTDLYARRSRVQPLHYLDTPLHGGQLERSTLDAMMEAIDSHRNLGRQALALRARALKKKTLAPWDLFAPAPEVGDGPGKKHPFSEGLTMVHEAFSAIHTEMGEFVSHMASQKWIEASQGSRKRPGAFCIDFPKSRTPRVYMTYKGSKDDIGTLAHELGHAFHSWVMRDLPLAQQGYPMTLAETASIFAETALADHLMHHTREPAQLLSVSWNDVSNIDSLLLNIPARFEFEKRLYDGRPNHLYTPDALSGLMREAWTKYYGDSLTEMNEMFWASKLHFHLADISFYNFPYSFGYLFSLGIYAKRMELGRQFYPAYVALLRDTGRMTVENLADKHLGVDLRRPDFWNASMGIVAKKLESFSAVLADCGL